MRFYVKLIPVQQAHDCKVCFSIDFCLYGSRVLAWYAKYVSGLKRYVKSSSGNGSRDVAIAVLQNDTSHTASTKNVNARHTWY